MRNDNNVRPIRVLRDGKVSQGQDVHTKEKIAAFQKRNLANLLSYNENIIRHTDIHSEGSTSLILHSYTTQESNSRLSEIQIPCELLCNGRTSCTCIDDGFHQMHIIMAEASWRIAFVL